MTILISFLAVVLIVISTFFSVVGVLGFHRLPDVYTRLHATGKVGTLGVVLLLLAAALTIPMALPKAIVLILFLLIVGPVTAHALGGTAYRLGIHMKGAHRNDLLEVNK